MLTAPDLSGGRVWPVMRHVKDRHLVGGTNAGGQIHASNTDSMLSHEEGRSRGQRRVSAGGRGTAALESVLDHGHRVPKGSAINGAAL